MGKCNCVGRGYKCNHCKRRELMELISDDVSEPVECKDFDPLYDTIFGKLVSETARKRKNYKCKVVEALDILRAELNRLQKSANYHARLGNIGEVRYHIGKEAGLQQAIDKIAKIE